MKTFAVLLAVLAPMGVAAEASLEELQSIYARAGIEVETERQPIVPSEMERFFEDDRSIDPDAAARATRAFETTYRDAEFVGLGASDPGLGVFAIERDGAIAIARFFLPVVNWRGAASDPSSPPYAATQEAIEALLGEPLTVPVVEIVELAWDAALSRNAIAAVPNTEERVFAWGVPPDFVQIVVTTQPDCTPLPTNNWLARHLCP